MTLPDIANKNVDLLRAIAAGPYGSRSELAAAADTRPDNLNRKLTGLLDEGLARATGDGAWEVELTEAGRRALHALAVYAGEVTTAASGGQVEVDPSAIDANPFQPRIVVDPIADAEMARSVADKGILQRILVRPHPDGTAGRYQQALGHRRVRGALAAGILVPVEIRELSDDDMAEIGVIENVQRADLHWMDEAEAYLMLAARGRSAAQIQQLVGTGGRKKRSIQEMIQFARELDLDAKAMARANTLSVDQARAMVGNKRARPALDLTPKLAVTLLELLLAADCAGGEPGDTMETLLHARPVGGPMITLSDRGLVKFKFQNGAAVAVIAITEDIAKYLHQVGYNDDPVEAVHAARALVMGELSAGVLRVENRYYAAELNPPERPDAAGGATEDVATSEDEALRFAGPANEGEIRTDEFGDKYQLRDGEWVIFAEPVRDETPKLALPAVSDDAALVLLELTHKIYSDQMAGDPLPSAAVDASYRRDPLSNQLVYDRLIMFRMMGHDTAAALTPTAQAWLDSRSIARDEAGRPEIDDVALAYIQAADGREKRGDYITPWLTITPTEAKPAHGVRDSFMQNVMDVVGEEDEVEAAPGEGVQVAALEPATLTRLMAAAREARALLQSAQGRKLAADEVKIVTALLDTALDAAQAALGRTLEPAL